MSNVFQDMPCTSELLKRSRDDIMEALKALNNFCDCFCVDKSGTNETDSPLFRCDRCRFIRPDNICILKATMCDLHEMLDKSKIDDKKSQHTSEGLYKEAINAFHEYTHKEYKSRYDLLMSGQYYRHFKGYLVRVFHIARHTEVDEECVVYCGVGSGGIWLMPVEKFLSEIDHTKYPEVKQKYRFELITGPELENMVTSMLTSHCVGEL